VYIPTVTSIGERAFESSWNGMSGATPMTITMGAVAPTIGTSSVDMFYGDTYPKTVTVRVPNGATGYTSDWKNAFMGLGNNDSYYSGTPTMNSYINLVIQYY
jgi:hypothetical protein